MAFALPIPGIDPAPAATATTPQVVELPPLAVRLALLFMMLSVTVFSRFGLRVVGSFPVEISLIASYLLLFTLLWRGWARMDPLAFVLYGLTVALATISLMVNHNFGIAPASANSLALLVAIYLPFAFALRLPGDTRVAWQWTVRVFSNVALFCAVAGIAQFYAQFVIHDPWLFNFNQHLPWRLQGAVGYHTVIPVGELFKSNGFFLREPSHFSFLMALALLIELRGARRMLRLASFGMALLLTYSGTGLLALALGLLFPLGRRTLLTLALASVGGVMLVWIAGEVLNLHYTVERMAEFGSVRSSAYARYVAPVVRLSEEIDAQPWSVLIGQGPGTMQRTARGLMSFDPTWAKLLYEYGLLGLLSMLALVGYCLTRISAPASVRVVLFMGWLVMGGYLLSAEVCALLYLLLGAWPDARASPGRDGAGA